MELKSILVGRILHLIATIADCNELDHLKDFYGDISSLSNSDYVSFFEELVVLREKQLKRIEGGV